MLQNQPVREAGRGDGVLFSTGTPPRPFSTSSPGAKYSETFRLILLQRKNRITAWFDRKNGGADALEWQ